MTLEQVIKSKHLYHPSHALLRKNEKGLEYLVLVEQKVRIILMHHFWRCNWNNILGPYLGSDWEILRCIDFMIRNQAY